MTNNLTPADVEFVPVTSIEVGDVLVTGFHNMRQQANEAPTARQLARATFITAHTIDHSTSRRGAALVNININHPTNFVTALATINVWRVKRWWFCDEDLIPAFWRRRHVDGQTIVGRVCNTPRGNGPEPIATCPNQERHAR